MTPDELADLKELHAQASPEPWVTNTWIGDDGEYRSQIEAANGDVILSEYVADVVSMPDHQMIREARNALPGLLAHIDKLTRRVEIYEERLGRVARNHPEAYAQALAGDTQ